MASEQGTYYVPEQSKLPIFASLGLFLTVFGAANWMNGNETGPSIFFCGSLLFAFVLWTWFSIVISENMAGLNEAKVKRSYVWGMGWFIFSEVMFFAAFFGALYYIRAFSVPWLGGEGAKGISGDMLWPNFQAVWPLMTNPSPELFPGPTSIIDAWHLPLLNTILLVTSSITVTFAHHALKVGKRTSLTMWLGATIILGLTFLFFQGEEYVEAYNTMDLTLQSGIYGSTFFLLTGFHGAHVTLGTLMLIIMFFRVRKGHFDKENHFAFEATSWYWHFVDVVWLGLFVLVYII